MTEDYQLFPPPTPERYEQLRDSIKEFGVLEKVVVDETGAIINGHQRSQIAEELGLPCPKRVVKGLTAEAKLDQSIALNKTTRGPLNGKEKREAIGRYLLRSPETSDRHIASQLGVEHHLVGSVRTKLQSGGGIPHLISRVGADGKTQSVKSKVKPGPTAEAVAERQAKAAEEAEQRTRREADLAVGRAKAQQKRQAQIEADLEFARQVEAEGTGARVRRPSTASRTVAAQDRIHAALDDCRRALGRVLNDPELNPDFMRAELQKPKDFQVSVIRVHLASQMKELKGRFDELIAAAKTSPTDGDSPDREHQEGMGLGTH